MEELIVIIIQVLFEFIVNIILNVLAYIPIDFGTYKRKPRDGVTAGLVFFLFLLGALFGALTLQIVGYHIIQSPALRILGLFLLPLASAVIFGTGALLLARSKPGIDPSEHFWSAFWFTLGLTLIRFAFGGKLGGHCAIDDSLWLTCHHG